MKPCGIKHFQNKLNEKVAAFVADAAVMVDIPTMARRQQGYRKIPYPMGKGLNVSQ